MIAFVTEVVIRPAMTLPTENAINLSIAQTTVTVKSYRGVRRKAYE